MVDNTRIRRHDILAYMSIKHVIFLLGLIALLLVGGVAYKIGYYENNGKTTQIANFEECMKAGYPIMESYPRQCKTPDGKTFTEEVEKDDDKNNLIHVSNPQPNREIASPLVVTGEARGSWYFEATFPLALVDWDGLIIAEGYAEAKGEWMTENFVPFEGKLMFKAPAYKNYGTLILWKSNPSGLPEHDDALEIPVLFRDTPKEQEKEEVAETGRERGGCVISGCSGEVCAEGDVITACEYKSEYACYDQAVCERQANDQCGWTLTSAVGRCLQELRANPSKQLQEDVFQ